MLDTIRVVAALDRSLDRGRLSHANLFVGPRGVGKAFLALNLAQALNCAGEERPCGSCGQCRRIVGGKHADVQFIGVLSDAEGPGRKVITIEQIREMQQAAELQPFEGAFKVFIIDGAEHLSQDAANCLLKTLEEPPPAVRLILLAVDELAILPTVLSRCQSYQVRPVPRHIVEGLLTSRYQVETERARLLASLADGSIGWAITAAQDAQVLEELAERIDEVLELPALSIPQRLAAAERLAGEFTRRREGVYGWLHLLRGCWRDALLVKGGRSDTVVNVDRTERLEAMAESFSLTQIAGALRQAEATTERLEKNANPRLALDVLMLSLPTAGEAFGAG